MGLAPQCALELRPDAATGGWCVRARVGGVHGETLWLADAVELDGFRFESEGRWWRADGRIALRGSVFGPYEVTG